MKSASKKLAGLSFVVLLAAAVAGCSKSSQAKMESAQGAVRKGEYRSAIIELKTILQAQPSNREARLLLGRSYYATNAYAEAAKELGRARGLGEPEDLVLPLLAKSLLKQGEHQKVIELGVPAKQLSRESLASLQATRALAFVALNKARDAQAALDAGARADAKQPELMLAEALMALQKEHRSEAEELVGEALQSDPEFVDALYLKARLLEMDGKHDEAIKVYGKIVAAEPKEVRAHLATAVIDLKSGKTQAADKAVHAAEAVAAQAPMVAYTRALVDFQSGRLQAANDALQQSLRVAPDYLAAVLLDAAVGYGLGQYERSLNQARRVLAGSPNNQTAVKLLAASQLKLGDSKEAVDTLTPLLAVTSDDIGLLTLAGEVYLKNRDYTKAAAFLGRAASLSPKSAAAKTRLAAAHVAMGEGDQAIIDMQAAAALSDKPARTDLGLVALYLSQKQYDQALATLDKLEPNLPNNPVTYSLRAAAYLGKNDRSAARKALEKALQIQPAFLPAAMNLAQMDMEDHKPDAARSRLEAVLAEDKNDSAAMEGLAGIALATGDEKGYVSWLEKAVKADPKAAVAASNKLVGYYLARKDSAKALSIAHEAVNENPDDPTSLNLLGATQYFAGETDNAIDTYSRLVARVPDASAAHYGLAVAQMRAGKRTEVRASLQRALELQPDMFQAQDAMIQLDLVEGKAGEATLKLARRIQVEQPGSPRGYRRAGEVLLAEKDYAQAAKSFNEALAKGGKSAAVIGLHTALSLAGDEKAADRRLTDWLSRNPNDIAVRAYAAEYYIAHDRNRDAIAQYEAILKLAPRNVRALNNLANLYQQEKDSRALATAEEALKLAPENPGVQDTLGWILLEKGEIPQATDLLRKATAGLPETAVVRYHYGVALARAGKKAEAKNELKAAVGLGQSFPGRDDAKALLRNL